MARNSNVRVDSVEVNATQVNVIGGCGLALFMKYLTRKGFFRTVGVRLPVSLSNAGYKAEVYVKALWALKVLYPDVNAPLSRIDEMKKSKAIKRALLVKDIPCSVAVGDWLRRMACCERVGKLEDGSGVLGGYTDGPQRVLDMFYEVTGEVISKMLEELGDTLDFDASCIFGEKRCDEWMYNDAKGSMSYLGFMGRICIMAELEKGNHSPSDSIDRRIGSCIRFAERYRAEVSRVRSDSAAYQSDVINACDKVHRKFYVRADADCAVRRYKRLGALRCERKQGQDLSARDGHSSALYGENGCGVHSGSEEGNIAREGRVSECTSGAGRADLQVLVHSHQRECSVGVRR
jgi:hypothetical protein